MRFVTEITKDNIHCCKGIMEFAEVRHLDGIVGNFGVTEKDYIAAISGTTSKAEYAGLIKSENKEPLMQPLSEAVYSNVKEFVQHQQFFFETLWNRAMPAVQRIREIEHGAIPEKTEILYGLENIINRILQTMSLIKERVDNCGDSKLPAVFVSTPPVMEAYMALKKRGIKMRFLTEITNENLPHCRKIMEFAEMRHLDGIKGNFGVTDNEFMANAAVPQAPEPLQQVVYSTVRAFVEQQQYSFQNLWDRAMPVEERIREIEEGVKPDVIETIRDPAAIQELGIKLTKSAQKDILVIFSTSNAFYRQERAGMFQLFRQVAATRPGLKIRILSPGESNVNAAIEQLNDEEIQQRIAIRNMPPSSETRVSILIVDSKFSLAVELKDDTKATSLESIGLASYSNSKATVMSYVSIFESLWTQVELYEQIQKSNSRLQDANDQLQIHDKMQKEFINIAAHELRSPIQPILGLSEVLRSSSNTEEQRKFLDVIINSALRLHQLTEDVLDVTRIEGNSLVLKKETTRISDVIKEATKSFESQIDKSDVTLVHNVDASDTYVLVDKGRMVQVMANLLSNAIKFTKKGVIRIDTGKKGKQLYVSVEDTGTGIDPEIFPRLFTKFATKSERGTGLGLFISKSIIEAHGGRIWAENKNDGKGATFTFTLPPAASN